MNNKEYLNEAKYQKTVKKISLAAVFILIIGLSLGGYLIYNGVVKPNSSKVNELQKVLEEKAKELKDNGIVYNPIAQYTDGAAYDLKIITKALDPSFAHCEFDEYKNNSITKEYCAAKNSISDFNSRTYIMLGAFICIATCMISFAVFMASKGREVAAFGVQQTMPLAQEGLEKMAPTVGKVGKEIMKEMAPMYGDVAKEISKGIKEGLKEEDK